MESGGGVDNSYLLSIRSFGSCQNASILSPYALFVGRLCRFLGLFSTPIYASRTQSYLSVNGPG